MTLILFAVEAHLCNHQVQTVLIVQICCAARMKVCVIPHFTMCSFFVITSIFEALQSTTSSMDMNLSIIITFMCADSNLLLYGKLGYLLPVYLTQRENTFSSCCTDQMANTVHTWTRLSAVEHHIRVAYRQQCCWKQTNKKQRVWV